jgi:pyrroloquinoline quinone biosynthesis protein B
MHVRILGSAAGGGVPQWNCHCSNCTAARAGSVAVRPRTQSSVAVSADGHAWFLLNVSPDIRQQILAFPPLSSGRLRSRLAKKRSSAIAGCLLTDAELDHTGGLLALREGTTPDIFCTSTVRGWLNQYLPLEPILTVFSSPAWRDLSLHAVLDLPLPDGSSSGLQARAFALDPHVPRFVTEDDAASAVGSVIGLEITDSHTGGRLIYAPCLASLDPALMDLAGTAQCLLIDGTFWDDDEPIRSGIGSRTARALGHLPVSGAVGSLNWLSDLQVEHRVYVHINNTNPMLNQRGRERRLVASRGVRVAADGDYFDL